MTVNSRGNIHHTNNAHDANSISDINDINTASFLKIMLYIPKEIKLELLSMLDDKTVLQLYSLSVISLSHKINSPNSNEHVISSFKEIKHMCMKYLRDEKSYRSFIGEYSKFILSPSTLLALGNNYHGQLGVRHHHNADIFTEVDLSHLNLKTDDLHCLVGTCHTVIHSSDRIFTTGNNDFGQLGLNHYDNVSAFTEIDLSNLNLENSYAFKGVVVGSNCTIIYFNSRAFGCGNNSNKQLGLGHNNNVNTFTEIPLSHLNLNESFISMISTSDSHTVICSNNRVFTCGENTHSQLGLGHNHHIDDFKEVDLSHLSLEDNKILNVVAAFEYTVIYTKSRIFTCGKNDVYQLGLGHNNPVQTFMEVDLSSLNLDVSNTLSVSASIYHTVFKSGNRVFTCGYNNFSHLGLGHNNEVNIFSEIDLSILNLGSSSINGITTSSTHTLIYTDEKVFVYGDNSFNSLGLGHKCGITTWTEVTSIGLANIIASSLHIEYRKCEQVQARADAENIEDRTLIINRSIPCIQVRRDGSSNHICPEDVFLDKAHNRKKTLRNK
ncbi:MAG: hypothetical protein HOI53_04465 [Francisellaceae bacterium]|nr:hypothetical protein [Francisellaceae bacterium]